MQKPSPEASAQAQRWHLCHYDLGEKEDSNQLYPRVSGHPSNNLLREPSKNENLDFREDS